MASAAKMDGDPEEFSGGKEEGQRFQVRLWDVIREVRLLDRLQRMILISQYITTVLTKDNFDHITFDTELLFIII